MRLSVRENFQLAIQYRCYLDDVDISDDCFAADDVEGWVDCYAKDEHGITVIRDDKPLEERRTGVVRLEKTHG